MNFPFLIICISKPVMATKGETMAKVLAVLGSIWGWIVINWTRKNWLWVRNGSAASLLFLAGLLNSKKLSDLLPGVLPDIPLDSYINMLFWSRIARWLGFVLLLSVVILFWLREDNASAPTQPLNPNLPKSA